MWSLNDWSYLEREVVQDPQGREWVVALMDILAQEGDADLPAAVQRAEEEQGRYFTLVFTAGGGALQRERGHTSLDEATEEYDRLVRAILQGRLDPSKPTFRTDLED